MALSFGSHEAPASSDFGVQPEAGDYKWWTPRLMAVGHMCGVKPEVQETAMDIALTQQVGRAMGYPSEPCNCLTAGPQLWEAFAPAAKVKGEKKMRRCICSYCGPRTGVVRRCICRISHARKKEENAYFCQPCIGEGCMLAWEELDPAVEAAEVLREYAAARTPAFSDEELADQGSMAPYFVSLRRRASKDAAKGQMAQEGLEPIEAACRGQSLSPCDLSSMD